MTLFVQGSKLQQIESYFGQPCVNDYFAMLLHVATFSNKRSSDI